MAASYNELFGLGTHSEDTALECWLKFQETTGTSAADSSSKARNGTITNMGSNPTTRTGPKNYLASAFDFDGTNDYVVMPRITAMESDTTYTVLTWLRSDSVTGPRLAYAYRSLSAVAPILAQIDTNGSDLRAIVRGDGNVIANATATGGASTAAWMHAALVRDGNTVTLYKNGASAATATATVGTITATAPLAGAGYASGTSTVSLFFDGGLAEQAAFTRNLTAAEVAEVYNGPEPLNTVAPTISGTATAGSVLTATTGTWNAQNNGTLSYTYQWTKDGTNISGATSSTYTTLVGDVGGVIRCRVRGTNDGGFDSAQDTVSSNSITVTASGVNATLDATDGADSLTATATVSLSATLSATDGTDSLSATATVALQATLAATDGTDSLAATATVQASASLAATDGSDSLSASATVSISASASVTDGADTLDFTAVGVSQASAVLNATDGADSLSATATVSVSSTLSQTDGSDSLSASATVSISAALAATDGADSVTITATSGTVLVGIYLGQIAGYSQTVICERTTVRAN